MLVFVYWSLTSVSKFCGSVSISLELFAVSVMDWTKVLIQEVARTMQEEVGSGHCLTEIELDVLVALVC